MVQLLYYATYDHVVEGPLYQMWSHYWMDYVFIIREASAPLIPNLEWFERRCTGMMANCGLIGDVSRSIGCWAEWEKSNTIISAVLLQVNIVFFFILVLNVKHTKNKYLLVNFWGDIRPLHRLFRTFMLGYAKWLLVFVFLRYELFSYLWVWVIDNM